MKIVYFSPIAYSDLKQRPQYFAEGLSQKHQVYYIEPTKRFLSYIKCKKEYSSEQKIINENFTTFRCDGSLVLPFRWNVYDIFYLNGLYEYIQLRKILKDADVVIVGFEGWYNVIRWIKNKKIIYDKMDDNTLLSNISENRIYLRKSESKLIKKSIAMMASAKIFVKRYEKLLPVYLIPNGFQADNYQYVSQQNTSLNGKVFGYVGMIAEWFDNKAIELIAENPNNQVVLVGPCETKKIEKKNVIYIGKVEKIEVEKYIRSFEVCMYPFKKSELLDTINPVKIYEYLSFNKPTIAVRSKEIEGFDANIYIYQDYDELKKICNQTLNQPFDTKEQYEFFMKSNSWDNRVDKINEILEELI